MPMHTANAQMSMHKGQMHQYTNAKCTKAKCSNAQMSMHKCTNAPMPNARMHKCTNAKNSFVKFCVFLIRTRTQANIPKILERLMKVAVPSLALWLLMFWGLFQVWLNIVAELTFFADREFYQVRW